MKQSGLVITEQNLKAIFQEEILEHPDLALIDIYKLFYQAHLGPAHIVKDKEAVIESIITEYRGIKGRHYCPPIQDIGDNEGFWRISLSVLAPAAKSGKNLFHKKCELLAELILLSCFDPEPQISIGEIWLKHQKMLQRFFPERASEWNYVNQLAEKGEIPSHSDQYRKAYNPHYRVVNPNVSELIFEFVNIPFNLSGV